MGGGAGPLGRAVRWLGSDLTDDPTRRIMDHGPIELSEATNMTVLQLLRSILLAGALAFALAACGSGNRPLRVAIAHFSHETCTFCPGGDTDVERWTKIRPPYKADEVFEASAYTRGFVARAREYGGVELIGLESPAEVFGGSSASWSTRDAFEHFMDLILADLRRSLPVDGVYLALHGAMAVREIPRPEAEIARRVREVVGPDVPIVGTFDLHGNEDEEFLRWADMAFVTKRYPHYDAYIQGERAARMLIATMRGEFEPTTATRKPGVITGTVLQWTGQSPSMDIMERARRWEAREDDAYVSVFYGFPWSDVPDVGSTSVSAFSSFTFWLRTKFRPVTLRRYWTAPFRLISPPSQLIS